jgi:hypothetical protein
VGKSLSQRYCWLNFSYGKGNGTLPESSISAKLTNLSEDNQVKRDTKLNWGRTGIFLLAAMFLTACGKEEIKVYSVPKEKAPARQMAAASTKTASHEENHPIHWTTPPGWEELAPTSMRVGNFLVTKGDKKAEVSILQFPGNVGTELDNVNRWRGEIGLKPIDEKEVSSQTVAIGRATGKLYDLPGATLSTIAAILKKGNTSWFFKMRGDKEIVSESKETFTEFLKSISFHSDEESEPPVAAKPVSTNIKEIPDETSSGEPKWDAPPNWQEKPPSAMVLKSFSVGDAEHEAKISITVFPGDVGGPLANVNRWRGQISLEPVAESELSKLTTSIDVLGGKATLVDMNGTDGKTGKPARLIAASVPRKEKTWFYKLMGDPATVAGQKEAFEKFVQTVRYPND